MAGDLKLQYAASATYAITLASLASSTTRTAGAESASEDMLLSCAPMPEGCAALQIQTELAPGILRARCRAQ